MEKDIEPRISVGIMSTPSIGVLFNGAFKSGDAVFSGEYVFEADGETVKCGEAAYKKELLLEPVDADATFTLHGVTIGVNFHWERQQDQTFAGALKLMVHDGEVMAINVVGVETYLTSVISSEMSATASQELLKAHAVISRSWLMAQISREHNAVGEECAAEDEYVRWYDRDDHSHFDVCADDHCQRYQGVTRQSTPAVVHAIEATHGEVLTASDGTICDARFSKCCGGAFERYENCWEHAPKDYLQEYRDSKEEQDLPDLTIEENAREWILGSPEAFCNTADAKILSEVLNGFDQETQDFYRWSQEYSQAELKAIIEKKLHLGLGRIRAMVPVKRGTSARLVKLRIEGESRTVVIGKELEIRRALSESHLYSSAFVVETEGQDADGYPERFVLRGAGWGHGVGLCQIGAAVMGERGYGYREILAHYYPNSTLVRRW